MLLPRRRLGLAWEKRSTLSKNMVASRKFIGHGTRPACRGRATVAAMSEFAGEPPGCAMSSAGNPPVWALLHHRRIRPEVPLWQDWVGVAAGLLCGAAVPVAPLGFRLLEPRNEGPLWANSG